MCVKLPISSGIGPLIPKSVKSNSSIIFSLHFTPVKLHISISG